MNGDGYHVLEQAIFWYHASPLSSLDFFMGADGAETIYPTESSEALGGRWSQRV